MTRSTLAILVDTVRTQALLSANYFAAKRDGLDEVTLRRLQRTVEDGGASALEVAAAAEALEQRALRAVEGQLSALRRPLPDHSDPSPPAA